MAGRGVGTGGRGMVVPVVGGERFGMRTGRSGRRYVFSRVDHRIEVGDLDGAVVVISGRGAAESEPVRWIGRGEDAPLGRAGGVVEIHAHWLAASDDARAAVIDDLGEVAGAPRSVAVEFAVPRRRLSSVPPTVVGRSALAA